MAIKKVLIANRGEIALRIIRTCREMGMETVSVHSSADEDSLHVKIADESVCIGPAKSSSSYLHIPSILSAAEITGADAIHPGYGFLSENAEFAGMCEKWGITFIGPRSKAIDELGDKIRAKSFAEKSGIPVLAPIEVNDKSDNEILKEVKKIGYPVIIKASAGGGGKGMRRVDSSEELISSILVLKEEARVSFNDDTLFIEKYVQNPRHIEVQIIADNHGSVIHLGERDCTVQRKFQKIIEESPSPILSPEIRKEICQSAVKLCKFIKYNSVGTVEFLYDQKDKKFYFMEMNTRIQVEHPVTEIRCGIDLIGEQIKVANNDKLSFKQKDIQLVGHSIECRINAEDPKTLMPSPGKIEHYHRPGGLGVRVDDYIYSGYNVQPFYDSLLSKVVVYGRDRDEAIRRMRRALEETILVGIKSNIPLHLDILNNENFIGNNYSTAFLLENF